MRSDAPTSNGAEGAHGERGAYIRGGAGRPVETGRLLRGLGAAVLAGFLALALALTLDAARAATATHRLRTGGVEVPVTVTGCLGRASGTGITPVGYTCRGSFTLRGRRYAEVIHGTSALRPAGQLLTGITDPAHPGLLVTVPGLESAPTAAHRFELPAALWLVVAAGALAALRLRRRGAGVIVDR